MVKRRFKEMEVSEIESGHGLAVVHGVVTSLLPVKKSKIDDTRRYFSANISDGINTVKVVSLNHPYIAIQKVQ